MELRIINSAFYNFRREIKSVREAIVALGLKTIRDWMCIIVLTDIDDKPQELISQSLRRARMMQTLSEIAAENGKVLKYPAPQILFSSLGASSLDFEFRVWIEDFSDRRREQSELLLEIDRRLGLPIRRNNKPIGVVNTIRRSSGALSADNPRNPNNPPKFVRYGEESDDEMCVAFLFVTRDGESLLRQP